MCICKHKVFHVQSVGSIYIDNNAFLVRDISSPLSVFRNFPYCRSLSQLLYIVSQIFLKR